MQTFKLKIITPEKVFFEGDVQQIIVRTVAGDLGVLAGHAPYVANLITAPIRVRIEGDEFKSAAVSEGIIKVNKETVVLVVQTVEWAEDIDVLRANQQKERAQAVIDRHESQKEFERAERRLKKALNRLTVAGK